MKVEEKESGVLKNREDFLLRFNEEDILHDKGKVTAAIAKTFAESEFEKFCVLRDICSNRIPYIT